MIIHEDPTIYIDIHHICIYIYIVDLPVLFEEMFEHISTVLFEEMIEHRA